MEKGLSDSVLDLYRSATGKHTASYEDIQNEYVNIEPEYGLVDGAKNTEPDHIVDTNKKGDQ